MSNFLPNLVLDEHMAGANPTLLITILITVAIAVFVIGASSIWETFERAHNSRDCLINGTRIEIEGGAKGATAYVVYMDTVTSQGEHVPILTESFNDEEDAFVYEITVNGALPLLSKLTLQTRWVQ
jgi:hypothetical protein